MGRDGEVLTRSRIPGVHVNEFEVPGRFKEEGWSYQWVRESCYGKPDPANVTMHEENGFRPVDAKRMPGFMGAKSGAIRRDGLVLMERPESMTLEAEAEDRKAARELRNSQAREFGHRELPTGFEDGGRSGDGRFDAGKKVRRTVQGAPVELLPKLELAAVDE